MKRTVFILILISSFTSLAQDSLWQCKADSLISLAKSQLGVKYVWGTSRPNVSFDCSGFTSYVYKSQEISNARTSSAFATKGVSVPKTDCRKGDCIIFSGTTPGSKTVGHVGIVLENKDGEVRFIHCSSSKKHSGVVISVLETSGYKKRFLDIRRLF